MSRGPTIIATILLVTVGTYGASAESSDLDRPCLLLRNDNVVFGVAQQDGEHVVVRRGDGTQLRIPREQVLCWADRLPDLYQYRLDHRVGSNVRVHLKEARWCLRYGLLRQAEDELRQVRRLDPASRQAELLRRQLAFATNDRLGHPPDAPTAIAGWNRFQSSVTIDRSPVQQVDHQIVIEPEMLHTFVSQVQPILINRCGNCHSHTRNLGWTLITPTRGTRTSARMARENYLATVPLAEGSKATESELLRYATKPHGGADAPLGPRNAKASATLQRWVVMIADRLAETDHQPLDEASPSTREERNGSTEPNWPAADATFKDSPLETASAGPSKTETIRRLPTVENPFDPELFNRSFHR